LRQARQRAAELLSAAAKNGADVEAATKQIELALSLEARLVLFPGMMQQPRDRLRVGRTPMKSLLIAGLFSALTINQANAQVYYNYPDWDRLSESARATYIAGGLRFACQHRDCGYRVCRSALFKVRYKPPAHE
jgi:hypothetical protein